jgi:gliding motility-associated-like protein
MRKQWILILLAAFLNEFASGQSCAEIFSNAICAQTDELSEYNLSTNPFSYRCFESNSSYSFLLTTGGRGGILTIGIQRTDCDYIQLDTITGTAQVAFDSIFVTLIRIDRNLGACDSSTYINQLGCYLMLGESQTFEFSNLPVHSDFLVVVGSNHNNALFGDCSFKVWAFGNPIELGTNRTPSFIFAGQEAQISVEGQTPGEVVTWTPEEFVGNANSPVTNAFPTESAAFAASSKIGECALTDTVYVTVGEAINFFNALSPNNDNINDNWEIYGIQKFPRAEVNVYDRWGQNVFRSIGYATPWDGTNRGKRLPTGSYYYVIELNSSVVYIEPYTGFISILH